MEPVTNLVQRHVLGEVGVIQLDHPQRRNALSRAIVDSIIEALAALAQAKSRAVILRATAGGAVWSAGHDVHELPESGRDPPGWDDPLRDLIREIEAFAAPVIAMVEGSVRGGACETVFACDLVVAAELEAFCMGMARDIAANAPLSVAVMKEQLRILAGAHPMSPQGFERIQGLRRLVHDSHDYREGIQAFTDKPVPRFRGA